MKWQIFALVLALFVSSAIAPAFAKGIDVPGDSNGDKIVSAEELKAAERLSQEGKITKAQLEEIKNIGSSLFHVGKLNLSFPVLR